LRKFQGEERPKRKKTSPEGWKTGRHTTHFPSEEISIPRLFTFYDLVAQLVGSTDIDALYQQYLLAEARQAPLQTKPWGFKEFTMRDPSGNLIIFVEHIPEADASIEQGA
jgi:hypothetical protein